MHLGCVKLLHWNAALLIGGGYGGNGCGGCACWRCGRDAPARRGFDKPLADDALAKLIEIHNIRHRLLVGSGNDRATVLEVAGPDRYGLAAGHPRGIFALVRSHGQSYHYLATMEDNGMVIGVGERRICSSGHY